jgi:predicted DCC family thiol-disulfide oxidoreductase YuxK
MIQRMPDRTAPANLPHQASPEPRPLMIYDGDCSFCRRWILRWEHLTAGAVTYEPYQRAASRFPQVPRENFMQAVHLVEPDGTITRGAEAVFRSLAAGGQLVWMLWLYQHVAFFRIISETAYRFVARHRNPIDRLDLVIVGRETRPATYVLVRALFLRLLGLVYLIAFSSLYMQMDGLFGSHGILPASELVQAAAQQLHASRWWVLPTLAYFNSSDPFLHGLCLAGIIGSILLSIGITPLLMTIVLWCCYLSLVSIGQIFLGYQWDALLLETGFLAILWAPAFWASSRARPPRSVLFLLRWLLFRLMFLSAIVKWANDEAWRNLTALRFHFETQPLPTWTSWSAHQSPHWLLAAACACMFIIEGVVPFLYFAPRRTRFLAFWLTVLFQLTIMATGNYGFFNLLTIALAVVLLDDVAIARLLRRRVPEISSIRPAHVRRWIIAPFAAVVFLVGAMTGIDRATSFRPRWPAPLEALAEYVTPFDVANSYGLFAVMTKTRPEIILEGSDDGVNWKPYKFKWKPGDVDRAPQFCEPHMPRLDWQMWFAALRGQPEPWFLSFVSRLLHGQPEVLHLMGKNPFPDHPPRYIRAMLYDYRFSDPQTRQRTSAWWVRTPIRIFLQPVSIRRNEPMPTDPI